MAKTGHVRQLVFVSAVCQTLETQSKSPINMRKNTRELRGLERTPSLLLTMALVTAGGAAGQVSAQNVGADSQTAYSTNPTNQPAWLNPAQSLSFSYGSFDLHPRLRSTTIYDDNILFAHKGRQQDVISQIAPGIQILGGDRQTLETYLNRAEYWNYALNLASLAASSLVVKPSEDWPDKFLLLDYSPQWQEFGKHSENDSLDQFVTWQNSSSVFRKIIPTRRRP